MDERVIQLLKDIRKLYSGSKIYLFGSHATGKASKYSDYDFIIVSEKFSKITFVNRGGTIWRNTRVGLAADFLCYTPKEFKRLSKSSVVLRDAMKHAIVL